MTRLLSGQAGRITRLVFFFVMLSCLACASALAQTLRGRVVDPDGNPVAAANVIIARADSDAIIATVTTAADGTFGPVALPPSGYDILVAAPGLRAAPRHISVEATSALDVDLPLALSAVQESVVVSGAQVDTPLSRATDSVTVIDRAELDARQTNTIADALRLVPGFGVVTSGTAGGVTSIFPRGGESNYTLILVDGIPQNAFGGGFDAAHLDTADVDRIEVVRGPESALYGNGAIGGIVHVITRQGGPPLARAAFEGGGYGFDRSTASASGSQGAWRWGGAIDRLRTDGDTRFRTNLDRSVANDDYERLVGSGSFGWSDRPSRSVRVDVRGDRNLRGEPGAYGSDPAHLFNGLDLVSRSHNTSREVGASAAFGSSVHARHRVQFTSADFTSEFTSPFGTSTDETRRTTGRYQFDVDRRIVGLSAGWEILHEQVDNTYITGLLFQPVPIARLVSGWFVEGRPSLGKRAFLTLGTRVERIRRSALEADPSQYNQRPTFADDVVWSVNPKVSAAWFVSAPSAKGWTKIRAGAGTGIKPPTGFEIAFTNNPNLKPERNRSVDVGLQQALAGSALVMDATLFANRYEDLIFTVGSSLAGASRYRTDNIANAASRGLEVGASWRGSRGLSARAAWTLLHTEVLGVDNLPNVASKPYYHVGDPLVRRPRQQGSLELGWSSARATVFVTVYGRGDMLDLEPNYASTTVTNPGYTTVSLGGSFMIVRHVEVFGRVMNALDRSYEEAFGFPALGRTASVGLRVAAGR